MAREIPFELSDSQQSWRHSDWLILDPAEEGMIGFDYDAELGQLIVAGYTQHIEVQVRGESRGVQALSTDHPEEVVIRLNN